MQPPLTVPTTPRERTLFFLSNPDLWTFWPFMPVNRQKPGGLFPQVIDKVFHADAKKLPG